MKKRISIITCLLVLILSLTGCGGNTETVKYDKEELTRRADALIQILNETDQQQLDAFKEESDYNQDATMSQLGLQDNDGNVYMVKATSDDFCDMIDAWAVTKEELGTYSGHDDYEIEATKNDVTLTADAQFSDRDGKITVKFDEKLNMTSLTVDGNYSTGEVLEKAGLNTLLGMGTVFVVLIFISFIISLFRFIPVIQDKFSKKPKQESTAATAPVEPAVQTTPAGAADEELVAVISAAIAAYEGTSADGFVVRSIKRKKNNNWNS